MGMRTSLSRMRSLAFAALAATALAATACQPDEPADEYGLSSPGARYSVAGSLVTAPSTLCVVTQNRVGLTINISSGSSPSRTIELTLPVANPQARTYTAADGLRASYLESEGGTTFTWTAGQGSDATLELSDFDTGADVTSGTFSFTAQPDAQSGAAGTRTVTAGRFLDLDIR